MNRKLILPLAATALLVVVVAGCQTLRDLNIQNPNYALRDVRPHVNIALPISASTIDFDFVVEVDNPNSVGLRLDEIDFALMVNGSRIAQGLTTQRIQIPANGAGRVPIRTSVGYNQIRTVFDEVVRAVQGREARYAVEGRAHYNTPVGRMSFPFSVYRQSL
jgi:hypothetical protein